MRLLWKPFWYELDQSVVVGDIDYFYISRNKMNFANGFASDDDIEIVGEIVEINHPKLCKVRGIVTIGLDYHVYLNNGDQIEVNAEETPGKMYSPKYLVDNWEFEIKIKLIEETGLTSNARINGTNRGEIKQIQEKRVAKYKRLLQVDSE